MRDVYYDIKNHKVEKEEVLSKTNSLVKNTKSLSRNELYALRLIVHDYSRDEIIEFLEVSLQQYYRIIKKLKIKLETTSTYKMILKAFELGFLSLRDFIDPIVKAEAVIYSKIISNKLEETPTSKEQLNATVFLFLNSCRYNLQQGYKADLTDREKKYLELNFLPVESYLIAKELELSSSQISHVKKAISTKLEIKNWCNVFKKGFQLQLIGDQSYYKVKLNDPIVEHTLDMIVTNSAKNASNKEKELAVYDELLNFYTTVEFNFLSQTNHSKLNGRSNLNLI